MQSAWFSRIVSTPARIFGLVFVVYFLSSFFSVTVRDALPIQSGDISARYRNNYWAVISMPRILRGDEMYYLMMAHSLAHDGDLFLSREYTHVQQGGPEMGVYYRYKTPTNFFQHFSRARNFTLLGNHPFGLSALLAMLLWPLAGTFWMEPAAIWVTVFWGAAGVLIFIRVLEALGVPWKKTRNAALLLAFATPWWSYSRTLYTEVYIGVGMLVVLLAVLRNRTLWALPFCMGMAWFKYPVLLLFFAAGTGEAIQRRWRNFFIFGFVGGATLLSIFLFNRSYFQGASWITRIGPAVDLPQRSAARAGAAIAWIPGDIFSNIRRLFTDYDKGLFPHCPLLLLAIAGLVIMYRTGNRRQIWVLLACGLPWTVLHISYRFLMTGDSYTTRYLVPVVPLVMVGMPWFWDWAVRKNRWWRWAAGVIVALSLINNTLAGILPGITFDRKPWEVPHELGLIIGAAIGR